MRLAPHNVRDIVIVANGGRTVVATDIHNFIYICGRNLWPYSQQLLLFVTYE